MTSIFINTNFPLKRLKLSALNKLYLPTKFLYE